MVQSKPRTSRTSIKAGFEGLISQPYVLPKIYKKLPRAELCVTKVVSVPKIESPTGAPAAGQFLSQSTHFRPIQKKNDEELKLEDLTQLEGFPLKSIHGLNHATISHLMGLFLRKFDGHQYFGPADTGILLPAILRLTIEAVNSFILHQKESKSVKQIVHEDAASAIWFNKLNRTSVKVLASIKSIPQVSVGEGRIYFIAHVHRIFAAIYEAEKNDHSSSKEERSIRRRLIVSRLTDGSYSVDGLGNVYPPG